MIEKAKKEEKIKLSLSTRLKGVFSKEVKLGESDIDNFTDELMLTLLQSDVSYETTDKFINSLKDRDAHKEHAGADEGEEQGRGRNVRNIDKAG